MPKGDTPPPRHLTEVMPDPAMLAEAIVKISAGFEALKRSGLNQKAIIVLLADLTHVGKRDIECVLAGLRDLAKTYTRT